jgi:hypothetical protein
MSEPLLGIGVRSNDLSAWLKKNHPEVFTEQKHLDEGSVERAYWHYGYMVAIQDVLRLLSKEDA